MSENLQLVLLLGGSQFCIKAVLSVLSVPCGSLDQCWESTAEHAEDAEEQRDRELPVMRLTGQLSLSQYSTARRPSAAPGA